jgi:RNA polymerase sigma factor (sigma-70 family)
MNHEIIQQAKRRDPKAINSIVHHHKDYVYRIAFLIVKDESTAKDLSQESFIKVMNKIHQYNDESKFETWLYRLVYNTCIDYLRKNNKPFTEINDMSEISYKTALEDLENNEKEIQIKHYLSKLPDKYRISIELFYYQEKSYQEISEIMEESLSNIKILLFRAKKIFKELLIKERFDLS